MDLRDVLTRSYKVATFTFNSTNPSGTELANYEFPELLFALPYLKDKLRDYMLFRGSVKLTFRFNTTKFAYGTFVVGYIPFYDKRTSPEAWRHITLPQLMQCDGTVISVTQGESVDITIPWICPKPYLKIADAGVLKFGVGGSVFVRVLNPLRSVSPGTPTPILVNVYACFDHPEVAGPSPDARAMAQSSNKVVKEAIAKKDIMVGVQEAASSVSSMIGTAKKVFESVGGTLSEALPLLATLAFNKPTVVNTPQNMFVDPDGFTHMYGEGVDVNPKVAIDPSNNISTDGKYLGVDSGAPNLLELCKVPGLIRESEIKNTDFTVGEFFYRIVNTPMQFIKVGNASDFSYIVPTPVTHNSMFFRYWRGSLKYVFDFRTSPLVTARVRIAHFPEQRDWSEPVNDYSGDVVSKVVDIAGDTMVPFSIPFLTDDYYKPLDKTNVPTVGGSCGVIALCFDSPIQGPDPAVTPSIFLNVFVAAGDDFQLMRYTSCFNDLTPGDVPIAQSNMRKIFKGTFEGLRPHTLTTEYGALSGEKMMPVQSYLHRYVESSEAFSPPSTAVSLGIRWNGYPDMHAWMCSQFLFWRGAMRMRLPFPVDGKLAMIGGDVTGCWDPDAEGRVARNAMKPTPGLEVPWYCPYMFLEVSPTQINDQHIVNIYSDNPGQPLTSVGDDFTVGPISACPQWKYYDPSASAETKSRPLGANLADKDGLSSFSFKSNTRPDPSSDRAREEQLARIRERLFAGAAATSSSYHLTTAKDGKS